MFSLVFMPFLFLVALAITIPPRPLLIRGDQPYFPSDIPSCVSCEPNWSSISSCADAAPVFENVTNIFWNPGAFVTAIQCACTDTFQAAYPACSDCFVQTNQCAQFLDIEAGNAPDIVQNMRSVCSFASTSGGFGVASSYSANSENYTYTGSPNQPDVEPTYYGPGGIDYGTEQAGVSRITLSGASVSLALLSSLLWTWTI